MGSESIARGLVPVQQLEGVGGAAPDADIAGREAEGLGEGVFGRAWGPGFGDGLEQPGFQADIGDPGGLIAENVVDQLVPGGFLCGLLGFHSAVEGCVSRLNKSG